jgi:hypothetical protein
VSGYPGELASSEDATGLQLHVDRIELDDDAGVLMLMLLSEHTEVLAELVEGYELIGRLDAVEWHVCEGDLGQLLRRRAQR